MSDVNVESPVAAKSPYVCRVPRASRDSAVAYVIDAVESAGAASRDDFDVDSIVATGYILAESWDFEALEPETFWRIASMFLRS